MNVEPLGDDAGPFLRALLAGDRRTALRLAREQLPRGIAALFEDVIRPAMVRVGELWQQNRISVAHEHAATAIAQAVVASLYPSIEWPVGGAPAIIGCGPGERHEFGARMVADLLTLDGWDVLYLGADTPSEHLLALAKERRPVLFGLSIALPFNLPGARETIAALRREVPGTRILVGGRAVTGLPDPARAMGADAVATSGPQAVDVARSWRH